MTTRMGPARASGMKHVLIAAALGLAFASAAAQDCAEQSIEGAFLSSSGTPLAAVVIKDGMVVRTSTEASAPSRTAASDPCAITLPEGAVVLPGLTDGHAHLLGIGLREMTPNLEGTASIADLQDRLRAAAADTPRGAIVGRGWIETGWPEGRMPTRADLDAVVEDRAVLLTRADGHALVANSTALWVAGIRRDTPDPEGGRIVRDAEGRATGVLVDAAMGLVADLEPKLTTARRREALGRGAALYAARGWTGLHDMSVDAEDVPLIADLARRGALPLRVWSYLTPEAAVGIEPGCDATGLACVQGVKLYVDGALGSRGALLDEPYADEPGTRGLQLVTEDRAKSIYRDARARGLQVTTHAIGDAGNRLVLDWYADTLDAADRPRIEHAQILDPRDIPRFARQGVIASMQPSHAIGDLRFAPDRLGDARLDGAYAWASLRGTGAVVVGGSDAPVEVGDPRIELFAATKRRALDGFQGGNWRAREALSERAALRLFTTAPAYAVGEEDRLGSIEPGYAADLSVFCGDPFGGPEAATPLFTMIGGEVVSGDVAAECPDQ